MTALRYAPISYVNGLNALFVTPDLSKNLLFRHGKATERLIRFGL